MLHKENPSQFEEFENYETFSDKEIFTKIWTEPRRVFTYINKTKYEKYFYLLLFLAGISGSLDRAIDKGLGENNSLIFVIVAAIIFGGLLGWIGFYIFAALISWTGKWLDGKGNTESIFRVMAYALIPSALSIAVLILQIFIFGKKIFLSDYNFFDSGIAEIGIFSLLTILNLGLAVYNIIFYVIAISVVQKLSIGKAILNLLLPILLLAVPLLFIIFFVIGFSNIF